MKQIKDAKAEFRIIGEIHFNIQRTESFDGWLLMYFLTPKHQVEFIHTQRGNLKHYKTIDAAYKDILRVTGVEEAPVTINWHSERNSEQSIYFENCPF